MKQPPGEYGSNWFFSSIYIPPNSYYRLTKFKTIIRKSLIMLDEEISKKMGKSAFYIFLGNLIGAFLNYAAKALIARAYSPSAYGLISLGLALFTLITY